MGYEIALFDLDSTLFDSELSEKLALSASFDQYEIKSSHHLLKTYRGINSGLWLDFENNWSKLALVRLAVGALDFLCLYSETSLAIESLSTTDKISPASGVWLIPSISIVSPG